MADPKKVLLMLPDGTEAYFPEQNKQAAIDQGAKEPATQAPPGIVTGVVRGLAGDAKKTVVDSAVEKAPTVGRIALDALEGLGTSFTGIPGQVVRLFGGDPKSVVVPGVYQTTENGEKIPATFESIGKPPDSTAGRAGALAGDVAQVFMGEGALLGAAKYGLAKFPQIASAFSNLIKPIAEVAKPLVKATETGIGKYAVREPLRYAGRAAAGAPVSAIQEASKTGDVKSAVEHAESGAALDAALNIFGRATVKATNGLTNWAVNTLLPKKQIGEERQSLLRERFKEIALKFTKPGIAEAKEGFDRISNNMKAAAEKGDEWIKEASVLKFQNGMSDPSGLIQSDARIADFPTKIKENWNKFKQEQGWGSIPPGEKQRLEKLFSEFMETVPNKGMQSLTLTEATEKKYELYKKLHAFYEKQGNPSYQISEAGEEAAKMRELFARTYKEVIQDGLGSLEKIRSQITPPAGTIVDKAQPWKVMVAPAKFKEIKKAGQIEKVEVEPAKFEDIRRAGQIASLDADLLTIAQATRDASGPQSGGKSAQSLVTMVSLAQLVHGQLLTTPSQFAALAALLSGGEFKTRATIPAFKALSTAKPPVSTITGTTLTSLPFREDQPKDKPAKDEFAAPLSK